jgi:SulP family sulfate permease
MLGIVLGLVPRSMRERLLVDHIDRKVPRSDSLVVVVVLGISICFDLSIAVIGGVLISIVTFAWDNSNRIHIESEKFDGIAFGKVIYYSEGPLFFGSAEKFVSMFSFNSYEKEVIIDLERTEIYDQSGMIALKAVYDNFVRQGKNTAIASLSAKSRSVMEKCAHMWEGVNFLVIDDTTVDEKYSTTSDLLLH